MARNLREIFEAHDKVRSDARAYFRRHIAARLERCTTVAEVRALKDEIGERAIPRGKLYGSWPTEIEMPFIFAMSAAIEAEEATGRDPNPTP